MTTTSKHDVECPDVTKCDVGDQAMHCDCKIKCYGCDKAAIHVHSGLISKWCTDDHAVCCECTEDYLRLSMCAFEDCEETTCEYCGPQCDDCGMVPLCLYHKDRAEHNCPEASDCEEEEAEDDAEDEEDEETEEEEEDGEDEKSKAVPEATLPAAGDKRPLEDGDDAKDKDGTAKKQKVAA